MAVYIFENTTQAEASSFANGDLLVFSNPDVNALNVGVTASEASGLSQASITLTANGQSLSFAAATLAQASVNTDPNTGIQFDDRSSLRLGDNTGNTLAGSTVNGGNADDVIYGFGGADTITGSGGNDYLYGGLNTATSAAGGDILDGGAGNDHLYGNALTTTQGTADGADSLVGGAGSDYLQGNAGNDVLDGGAGSDRLFGGNGADVINGGTEADQANGNVGDDTINGDDGNDILRGGQGNDLISGGDLNTTSSATSNDILYGDLGNDTLDGGTGLDVLFGGNGNDTFSFTTGDSTYTTTANATNANVTDVIADYTDGSDKIDLDITVAAVLYDTTGTTLTTLEGARNTAAGLFASTVTADNTEVASLQVGANTYLFYGGTANAIQLLNVTASTINSAGTSDFS